MCDKRWGRCAPISRSGQVSKKENIQGRMPGKIKGRIKWVVEKKLNNGSPKMSVADAFGVQAVGGHKQRTEQTT